MEVQHEAPVEAGSMGRGIPLLLERPPELDARRLVVRVLGVRLGAREVRRAAAADGAAESEDAMKYPWKQNTTGGASPLRAWDRGRQNTVRRYGCEGECGDCEKDRRRFLSLWRLVERRGGWR